MPYSAFTSNKLSTVGFLTFYIFSNRFYSILRYLIIDPRIGSNKNPQLFCIVEFNNDYYQNPLLFRETFA